MDEDSKNSQGDGMRHSHPFFKDMIQRARQAPTREERIKIMNASRAHALKEFPIQLERLDKMLLNYNPLSVLALFGFYDLTYSPEAGRRLNEGDPIEQYHIEFVQALVLRHRHDEFTKIVPDPVQFQELRDLVTLVACYHSIKDLPDYSQERSVNEKAADMLRSLVMAHTKAVRNWGYEEQTIRVLKGLYSVMEGEIEQTLGVRVSEIIDGTMAILKSIEPKVEAHFAKMKAIMRASSLDEAFAAHSASFNDKSLRIEELREMFQSGGWTLDQIKRMLIYRGDHSLFLVFALDQVELANHSNPLIRKTADVLLKWAIPLGAFGEQNPEHFLLGNPIWLHPIIRVTERIIFWPVWSLFNSFCFELIESVVCEHPKLRDRLLERKGRFLEKYTRELFKNRFPDARLFAGSIWKDATSERNGENDLLVIFDSVALVIEEKSGAINRKARRGGPSIKQEIEQLITHASEQANAFASLLMRKPGVHRFPTKDGDTIEIDSSKIRQFFCMGITLERFGPMATQTSTLSSSGLARDVVEKITTMSVADLEIALELLPTPFEFIHYLTRRIAFEKKREFVGDELDLLTFYITTGFAKCELPPENAYHVLAGMGSKLDPFFVIRRSGQRLPPPTRELSVWWRELLQALEKKPVYRRYELGCILLDMPDENQEGFERDFRQLRDKVKADQSASDHVECVWRKTESDVSHAVIAAIPFRSYMSPARKNIIDSFANKLMEDANVGIALIIVIDVGLDHWPYSGIYLLDRDEPHKG